jgi:PilZ domain
MSTHAIVWFHDDDILSLNDAPAATAEVDCERRWERVKIDVRIRVTYSERGLTEHVDGQGNDVSEGGMATYIPADLNVGDNVVLELVRRYGQPRISVSAKVNNRNGFRYGLEFVGIKEDERAGLLQAITDTTPTYL